ncbi:PadR family transcriptional regulator [Alicyclobacillus fastidiosus]|uniref:PadR family transcriptional regulator n=1 Tax=Alicyclobacillus fastidiosus TaxID=392011 RepID=A0ABV5AE87_9BACL|nr:PadR family transcriptional regulator [Alicyclobacillus fastidiosus]WEH09842.1 PadR family transcriptional regulator [Alicyclobacillus fastidiosus]
MYELFILGELKDKPMHGYLLHRILSQTLGPLRQVSWGVLYSVIARMEEEGHIQQVTDHVASGRGKPRKVYEITPSGNAEFQRLVRRPFEHNQETEDLFRVKLGKFHHIDKPVQLDILRQYKAFLEVAAGGLEVQADHVKKEPCISDEERPHLLHVIDYEVTIYDAKIAWVEAMIASAEE